LFGTASRSVWPPPGFTVRRTDPSQPCTVVSNWKTMVKVD
jgi:hypothetical protein